VHGYEIDAFERDGLPAVLVDVAHPRLPRVVIDNVQGGELAAAHLLARGHRRIGFVGDHPTNEYGFTSSEDRRLGFRAVLGNAGVEPVERSGPHGRDEAEALAESLLRLPDPPSAIFAASDLQAIGVLKAAERLGLRVPEDLAVIGFDDVDLAEIVGLTTIRQPLREGGALAADLLLAAIEHGVNEPVEELQELTIVERRTT
jgi:LacI family transcriptional regulator/LacI family repressor for deo operon, udp, cdd, tsx, nupC, and nupG